MKEKQYITFYMCEPFIGQNGKWTAFASDYRPTGGKYFVFKVPVPEQYLGEDLGVAELIDEHGITTNEQ